MTRPRIVITPPIKASDVVALALGAFGFGLVVELAVLLFALYIL